MYNETHITGKIKVIEPVKTINTKKGTLQKRELLILVNEGKWEKIAAVGVWDKHFHYLDGLNPGDEVKVWVNVDSKPSYQGSYLTNLYLYKLEGPNKTTHQPSFNTPIDSSYDDDVLPF